MGVMTEHVQADKNTGRLMFRRAYPANLRSFVPGNRRELKRSLRAKSLKDPEAQRLLSEAEAQFDRDIVLATKAAAGRFDPLDSATIAYLAEAFRVEALEKDEEARWENPEKELLSAIAAQAGILSNFRGSERSRWAKKRRETLEASIAHSQYLLGTGDMEGIREVWAWEAEQFALARGMRLDTASRDFDTLCRNLCSASQTAAETSLSRLDGEQIATPEEPPLPCPSPKPLPAPAPAKTESMEEIANGLIASRIDAVGVPTAQAWRTALRFWREAHGDVGWSEITRRMVSEWLDLLAQRPSRLPVRHRTLPLRELCALYATNDKFPPLSGKTIHQHLTSLQAIWNKAERKGIIEDATNPFEKHGVSVQQKAGGNELTVTELNALFSLPVFTAGERPRGGKGEAAYWIPLFGLFTGARPGEIAQLIVSDFWQNDEGRWMMRYTDDGEHPALGKRNLKTSRHGTGSRVFPVPETLLDLGLPAYLDWLIAKGEAALFPKLTVIKQKGLYEGWARWWRAYVRDADIIGKNKRQMRELRHNFPTAARESGLPSEAIAYLLGHAATGMTSRYGSLAPHGECMSQVRFNGLEIEKILPWSVSKER